MSTTIVAQSTPAIASAIAIIRLSGKDALPLCRKFFSGFKGEVKPRYAYFGKFTAGGITDDCICIYFAAPHSYTGEDMAEIAKLDIGRSEIVDHSDPKFLQMLHRMKVHE